MNDEGRRSQVEGQEGLLTFDLRLSDGGVGDEFVEEGDDGVGVVGVAEGGESLDGLRQVQIGE